MEATEATENGWKTELYSDSWESGPGVRATQCSLSRVCTRELEVYLGKTL